MLKVCLFFIDVVLNTLRGQRTPEELDQLEKHAEMLKKSIKCEIKEVEGNEQE